MIKNGTNSLNTTVGITMEVVSTNFVKRDILINICINICGFVLVRAVLLFLFQMMCQRLFILVYFDLYVEICIYIVCIIYYIYLYVLYLSAELCATPITGRGSRYSIFQINEYFHWMNNQIIFWKNIFAVLLNEFLNESKKCDIHKKNE